MGRDTKIQWCDHTAQFWEGCEKKDPGCKNCYAETLEKKFGHKDIWGKLKPRKWTKGGPPLIRKLNRECEKAGRRDIVFINDLSDFFEDHTGLVIDHKKVPVNLCTECGYIGAWAPFGLMPQQARECCSFQKTKFVPLTVRHLRESAFKLFDECQHLIFLLLTKRPENVQPMWQPVAGKLKEMMRPPVMMGAEFGNPIYRPNVGLGTSISDQATADKNIPELMKCRDLTPLLFVSYEPALGPVDFWKWFPPGHDTTTYQSLIDWLIIGGESGQSARAFDLRWASKAIHEGNAAGVPVFVKQLGSKPYDAPPKGIKNWERSTWRMTEVKDAKGGDIFEWPYRIRVREWPELLRRSDEASATQDDKTSVNAGDVPTRA